MRQNARLAEHFMYFFFATSLINSKYRSPNVKLYLLYDIKIILKSHFMRLPYA